MPQSSMSRYAINGENDTDVVLCTRNVIFGVWGICSGAASLYGGCPCLLARLRPTSMVWHSQVRII